MKRDGNRRLTRLWLAATAALVLAGAPGAAQALQCSLYLYRAESAIGAAEAEVTDMAGMVAAVDAAYARTLLQRARDLYAQAAEKCAVASDSREKADAATFAVMAQAAAELISEFMDDAHF